MALLTSEAKQSAKPLINFLWAVLVVCIMVTLGAKYVIGGFPPYIAWLKWASDFVIIAGLIGVGLIVADKHKLVK